MGMTVVGRHSSINSEGRQITTLHVLSDFDSYYNNEENGRICEGRKAESVYVGTADCSGITVGSCVELYYEKAISSSKGTFQKVKKIEVLKA